MPFKGPAGDKPASTPDAPAPPQDAPPKAPTADGPGAAAAPPAAPGCPKLSDISSGADADWIARVVMPPTFPNDISAPSAELAQIDELLETRHDQLEAILQWIASARDAQQSVRDQVTVVNETQRGIEAELKSLSDRKHDLELKIKQDRLELQRAKAREQLAKLEELMSSVAEQKAMVAAQRAAAQQKVKEFSQMTQSLGPSNVNLADITGPEFAT